MNQNILEKLKKADYHQILGEYDIAIGLYTEILAYGDDYDTTIKKVVALIKLNNLESAIKDCDNAIFIDKKRYDGYYQRGNFYKIKDFTFFFLNKGTFYKIFFLFNLRNLQI